MFRGTPRCTVDPRGRWWPATPIGRDHSRYRADTCRVPVGMDIDHCEPGARLIPALHDTDCDSSARGSLRAVRAEAVRQVRWLQRAWARSLTAPTSGLPRPIDFTTRVRTDR